MQNTQPTKTKKESGSKAAMSGDLTLPLGKASTPLGVYKNLSIPTTATMPKGTQKTWTSAELEVLKSKAGLVAGALADWQAAGGLVVARNFKIDEGLVIPRIYLVAAGIKIQINKTSDGLEFDLVAVQ